MHDFVCASCGQTFSARRSDAAVCSATCRQRLRRKSVPTSALPWEAAAHRPAIDAPSRWGLRERREVVRVVDDGDELLAEPVVDDPFGLDDLSWDLL
jgi:hypothetical protein